MSSTVIAPLQTAIGDKLRAELTTLAIVDRTKGVVANEVEAAVSKKGICLYVFPPLPQRCRPDANTLYFEEVEIRVRILEQPPLNATGFTAYELVETVLQILHLFEPTLENDNVAVVSAQEFPVEEVEDKVRVIFDVLFKCAAAVPPRS